MPRVQGLTELTFSGDLAVKAGVKTTLFSMTLSWAGAAAGQKVNLRDGSNGNAPFAVPIVLESANGTMHIEWAQGKEFQTGLFIDTQGGGQIQGCITYK